MPRERGGVDPARVAAAIPRRHLHRWRPARGRAASPSFRYSELDICTKPRQGEGHTMRVMLQCRQKPGSFSSKGETIGWPGRWVEAAILQHFGNSEIERFTQAHGSIITNPGSPPRGHGCHHPGGGEEGKLAERARLQRAVDDARPSKAVADAEAKARQTQLELKAACDALVAAPT